MNPEYDRSHYNACYRVRQLGCNVDVDKKIIEVDKSEFDYWAREKMPKSVLMLHQSFDYRIEIKQ